MTQRTINGVTLDVISPSFYTVSGKPQLEISFVGDCWLLFCDDASLDGPIYHQAGSLAEAVAPIAQAWKNCGLIS
jgi:hypothetical protein